MLSVLPSNEFAINYKYALKRKKERKISKDIRDLNTDQTYFHLRFEIAALKLRNCSKNNSKYLKCTLFYHQIRKEQQSTSSGNITPINIFSSDFKDTFCIAQWMEKQ